MRCIILLVLLLLGCQDYKYDNAPDVEERGGVTKSFTPAHVSLEMRSSSTTTGRRGHRVTTVSHYIVPVSYPDDYRMSFTSGHCCERRGGSSKPFQWDEWSAGEPCVMICHQRFRTPVDKDGKPEGSREFHCWEFVRVEKPAGERGTR